MIALQKMPPTGGYRYRSHRERADEAAARDHAAAPNSFNLEIPRARLKQFNP
jgi:hypothetical protein